MKLIDVLNKKANGELEDGTRFALGQYVYRYNKSGDIIVREADAQAMGQTMAIDKYLKHNVYILKDEGE